MSERMQYDPSISTMEPYSGFRPTGFDPPGLAADRMGHDDDDPDRSAWLVVPVGITRDSGLLSQSNWDTACKILEEANPDGDDWETHRFGHWGPGWFEILIVRPDTDAHQAALGIEFALADYPVLDDDDHSDRRCAQAWEDWENWGASDVCRELERDYMGSLEVDLSDVDIDALYTWASDAEILEYEDDGLGIYMGPRHTYINAEDVLCLPGALVEDRPVSVIVTPGQYGDTRSPILSKRQWRELRNG